MPLSKIQTVDNQVVPASVNLGRRNKLINGDFQVFQKGSGGATAGNNAYGKTDRFKYFVSGVTTTQDQQSFTHGQTDVPGEPTYFMRNILASNSGNGDYYILAQHIEDVKTCAGQEVTLSFYAKSSVNGNKVAIEFNQEFGTSGSSRATSTQTGDAGQLVTLTTSWARYTVTTTIDSIAGKTLGPSHTSFLELYMWMSAGSTYSARSSSLGNQSGNFDFADIQLEIGDTATPFERRPFHEQEHDCHRYYYKKPAQGTLEDDLYVISDYNNSTSNFWLSYPYPRKMRVRPTYGNGSGWVDQSPLVTNEGERHVAFQFNQGGAYLDKSTTFDLDANN